MPAIAIATPFNISLDFTIAPFWKRMLAYAIDLVILFVYCLAYIYVIAANLPDNDSLQLILGIFICYLPILLYHFLSELFFSGQSIGKKILGIRVVNITGNEASISQYLIRLMFRSYILAPLAGMIIANLFVDLTSSDEGLYKGMSTVFTLLASLGMFLYYVLNKYGQRLGDMLASTLVIENPRPGRFSQDYLPGYF